MAENALGRLRSAWFGILAVTLLTLGAGGWFLASWWRFDLAIRWVIMTACLAAYVLGSLWVILPLNRRPLQSDNLPSLGIGNVLTVARGILLAIVAGFLLLPRPTGLLGFMPGSLFTTAVALDYFDGYLARRSKRVTQLGEALDLRLDGLAILVGSSLAVHYEQVPTWFLLVGLARYLFIAGQRLLVRLRQPLFPLDNRPGRRPIAGVMMGLTAVLLFPFFSPPATHLAGIIFSVPFLAGFMRDFLMISGKMPRKNWTEVITHSRSFIKLAAWFPFILRLLTTILLAYWLIEKAFHGTIHSEASSLLKAVIIVLSSVSLVLLTLGAAGRIAALGMLIAVGFFHEIQILSGIESALLIAGSVLFLIGSGPCSLWTPENKLIEKRLGEV